jgi:hypothetical protein
MTSSLAADSKLLQSSICSSRQQYDAETQVRTKPGENKGHQTTALNNYINNITTLSDVYGERHIFSPFHK